jgi:RsiW-degrading membrane proteinase PrsW (M82 family)
MKQIESLFLGIIAALGALFLELIVFFIFSGELDYGKGLFLEESLISSNYLIIATAFIEELFKYLIIVKRLDYFSLGRGLIFNSLLLGLGFAAVESILIFTSTGSSIPYRNLIEISILHIFTAGLAGYFVATRNPQKLATAFKAVSIATFLHLAYNFMAINRGGIINLAILLLLGTLVIFNLYNLAALNRKLAS